MSKKMSHIYEIGEIVNNSLLIIKQTRSNRKTYEVQSLIYPKAPTYTITEGHLKEGKGCAYNAGQRVCEENSLYSLKELRKYIVDIEQSKKVTYFSGRKIQLKCFNCNHKKQMNIKNFVKQGFGCVICSRGTSYPELFFISYLEVKDMKFECQKIFKDLSNRRFDFYIESIGLVETHGEQHYSKRDAWGQSNERTVQSDIDKRKYCKDNDILLIELDCRESSFKFIKNNINKNSKLPNITREDEVKILKVMEKNRRYPIKEIIASYIEDGLSTYEVGKKFNISNVTIGRILKNNNIVLRGSNQYNKK